MRKGLSVMCDAVTVCTVWVGLVCDDRNRFFTHGRDVCETATKL